MPHHQIDIPRVGNEQVMTVVCNTSGLAQATVILAAGGNLLTASLSLTPNRARLVARALNETADRAEAERAARAERAAKKRKVAA